MQVRFLPGLHIKPVLKQKCRLSYLITMANFQDLGVASSFKQALDELGLKQATEIQEQSIPLLLKKTTDLVAQAQTGTGKTAAFGLPLLHKVDPEKAEIQALVITPTRELCQQVAKQLFRFTKYGVKIFTEAVYGGAPIGQQIKRLDRPSQIIVATPGRLLDLLDRKALSLGTVHTLVLDEADEILKMGFQTELDKIIKQLPALKQTWLFSATLEGEVESLIGKYLKKGTPVIKVAEQVKVSKTISHYQYTVPEKEKLQAILDLLREFEKEQEETRGIIFCQTKNQCHTLGAQLKARNVPSGALHGDLQQSERDTVMRAFKNRREFDVLIATDVAARGLDIDNLAYVIHYSLPETTESYTHRSGRTGRAGETGNSIVLLAANQTIKLREFEKALNIKFDRWNN